MVREHTEKVKPPRALFVPFPFGHALGRPNDADLQHRVLRAALDLLSAPAGPVLVDFHEDAEPGDQPGAPTQASAVTPAENVPADVAADVRVARWFWGKTAAGQLLRRVKDRLDASDDPKWKAAAFGIAR